MNSLDKIRQEMQAVAVDALLISRPANLSYLLDFADYEGLMIITLNEQYLYTDGRFFAQIQALAPQFQIVDMKEHPLADFLKSCAVHKLMIEPDFLNVTTFRQLEHQSWSVVDSSNLVEKIRMVKTPAEIAKVQAAAQIADQVFDHILKYLQPGQTELAIATEMEHYGKKLGATATSFPTIVASGVHSAMPHATATNKVLAAHELVVLDYGFVYQGYDSDITRTVALGSVDPQLQQIYQIVLEAQTAIIKQLHLNQPLAEIDKFAHDYIAKRGFGPEFMHGTGHSVGRECHEYPTMNAQSIETLPAQMTFTIEPGIYLPNHGGVRIEDDLYLDTAGQVHFLTNAKRELIVL
ncbi:MAG: aminopeptidase P family protein [Bombilactobacillus mellifer]|uniref:M24 family metallopeptidase n=1 Tax=Bombilactobacillus mellifer TaxID=1218492 RepID=UPI0023F0C6A9|nr:aminopeptidase P family protein [Bombilactobacillus mellifer]MCT6826554.1 aminopeptidase P family protein [Bombilactobacillus mellifer]MCT6844431.1 aminopeptidase P family protein [Bombilactobacillus mellifer]MCT6894871.1 aminopeptidase P family protein [Bombilactobacillus mellifer]